VVEAYLPNSWVHYDLHCHLVSISQLLAYLTGDVAYYQFFCHRIHLPIVEGFRKEYNNFAVLTYKVGFLTSHWLPIHWTDLWIRKAVNFPVNTEQVARWCNGKAFGLEIRGRMFKSCSRQSGVTTLGKLFTPMWLSPSSITWYRPKGGWCSAAGEVTAGLAESNSSLPPGGWLMVTCRLIACTPGSAPGPTLGIEYGKPLP